MQLRAPSPGKAAIFTAVTGLAGLLIGLAVSVEMPKQYVSRSLIRIGGDQPLSAEALNGYFKQALNRSTLTKIQQRYKLYSAMQPRMSREDMLTEMKENIVVRPVATIKRSTGQGGGRVLD